jgi:hypothetical protein
MKYKALWSKFKWRTHKKPAKRHACGYAANTGNIGGRQADMGVVPATSR